MKHCTSRLLGRLCLVGTEGVGLTFLGFMSLGDHRADKKNRQESRRYSSRQKSDSTLGQGVSKAYVWTGGKLDGMERSVPEGGGGRS